jgi:hypothetical protein
MYLYNIELEESKKQSPGNKKKTQLSFASKPGTSSQSNCVKNNSI